MRLFTQIKRRRYPISDIDDKNNDRAPTLNQIRYWGLGRGILPGGGTRLGESENCEDARQFPRRFCGAFALSVEAGELGRKQLKRCPSEQDHKTGPCVDRNKQMGNFGMCKTNRLWYGGDGIKYL